MSDPTNDPAEINELLANAAAHPDDGAPVTDDGPPYADELPELDESWDGIPDEPWDGFNSDAEADADVLASAGYGTDEDYGSAADMY